MMKQIELSPETSLEQILRAAKREDVIVMRQGHAVVLVSEIDDDDMYWYARERDPEFLASLDRARAQVRQAETTRHKDLKRRLGIK